MGKRLEKLKDSLEERARGDIKEGGKHLYSSPVSVFGNVLHAIGSLVYGAGRLIRGTGQVGGKAIDIAGTGAGRFADYLGRRVADTSPRQKYVTIPVKKYKELLELEPEKQELELMQIVHRHGDSIQIPTQQIPNLVAGLQHYSRRRHGYEPQYGAVAAFLLIVSAILADFTVTGAAIGTGGFATFAPVFSLLFLLIAIALFYKN